jgi:hypothetical protein
MTLLFGLLFGAIGSGYLLYAKKQYDGLFAIAGFALVIFPYFIESAALTFVVGALLCVAPFAIRQLS